VCSFPQRIDEIVTELPRVPEKVNVVRMVRSFKKGPNGEVKTKDISCQKKGGVGCTEMAGETQQ